MEFFISAKGKVHPTTGQYKNVPRLNLEAWGIQNSFATREAAYYMLHTIEERKPRIFL